MNDQANNEVREAVLRAIRESLAASVPFDAAHREHRSGQTWQSPRITPPVSNDREMISLVELFRENLTLVGGDCVVVPDDRAAAQSVQDVIDGIHAKRIALSDSALVQGLSEQLTPNAEVLTNATPAQLFDCDVGITGAQWAIAETGTLVLESERESNRLTSLIPSVHVCLIPAECIRRSMGKVLGMLLSRGRSSLSRTVTFITGPSRTSDIELTLAIGVHGPKKLHVVIIQDSNPGIRS